MIPVAIGVSLGLLLILVIAMVKRPARLIMYGLILTAIAFIYVGFTWSDTTALVTSCIQGVIFVFITLYGITRNVYVLGAGYILHGLWDVAYHFILDSSLVPPRYDWFCLSVDFVMGAYLLLRASQFPKYSADK